MSVVVLERAAYRLIRIEGFLDGRTPESRRLPSVVDACEQTPAHYVIDLSAVEYVNSASIGCFLRLLAAMQASGRRVLLLNPPPHVKNILEMTGLTPLFPMADREEDCIAILRGSAPSGGSLPADIDYRRLASEIDETVRQGGAAVVGQESQLRRLWDASRGEGRL